MANTDVTDFVTVTVSVADTTVTRAGFGKLLVMGKGSAAMIAAGDRYREYSSAKALSDEGYALTSFEYLAAAAVFSQNPHPKVMAVGRRTSLPTQAFTLTPTYADNTLYRLSVDGLNADYTTATSNLATLVAGIKAAIDALALPLTVTTPGNTAVHVVANAAGDWHNVGVPRGYGVLKVNQDHADGGAQADLTAIAVANDTWYGVINPWNSKLEAEQISLYAEANQKLFVYATIDDDVRLNVGGNEAAAAKTASRDRTFAIYQVNTGDLDDADLAGAEFAQDPGSETWHGRVIKGAQPIAKITATEKANLQANNVTYFLTAGGVTVSFGGRCSSGKFADILRGTDWLGVDMSAEVFSAQVTAPGKLPFTDKGIAVVESAVKRSLARGVRQGFVSSNPAPTTSVLKVTDVDPTDKRNRILRNVQWLATLQGAIHDVDLRGQLIP